MEPMPQDGMQALGQAAGPKKRTPGDMNALTNMYASAGRKRPPLGGGTPSNTGASGAYSGLPSLPGGAPGSGGMPMPGGAPGAGGPPMQFGLPGQTSFSATNNLIGSQFNPTNSAATNQAQTWTQNSGNAYNNYQFSPFQQLAPVNFGAERGMLNGAQSQMQGLQYNNGAANSQYANAQGAQTSAMNRASGAMQGLQGLGANGFGSATSSASTGRFNSELDGALTGLNGPDRAKIAAETMGLLEERSRPGFEQDLRGVNQKSAAMGRRGSGITTNELGDVTLARERELALARRDVANDAASRTLSDRLDVSNFQRGVANDRFGGETFNASLADAGAARNQQGAMFGADFQRGIANDMYGMGRDASDLAMGIGDRFGQQDRDRVGLGERQAGFSRDIALDNADFTRDEWGSARDERDAGRADEYGQFDVAERRFGMNQDYLGRERDNDFNGRQEMRGERQFQYGLSRDAMGDEYDRMNFEENMRNGRFNRAQGTAALGFNAPSPTGAYQNASNTAANNSSDAWGAFGSMMQGWGQRRSGAGRGTSPNGGWTSGGPPSTQLPAYG